MTVSYFSVCILCVLCNKCLFIILNYLFQFRERDFNLRTRAGHLYQCQQIVDNPDLGKVYGIKRLSVLCNSRYFNVIDGLPGDVMHDLLEGVLQYECKEMLKIFINEQKYLTLNQLNERIKRFDFGYYNDKNKPSPISHLTLNNGNNSLKQKGLCESA